MSVVWKDYNVQYREIAPPVPPRTEWPKRYIGKLGKQDSEYDNELAESAECVFVQTPLDRFWDYMRGMIYDRSTHDNR